MKLSILGWFHGWKNPDRLVVLIQDLIDLKFDQLGIKISSG